MPAVLLDQPPDSGLWLPPDALGPDVKIVYTKGRNNGAGPPYYGRRVRDVITTECSHTMGGAGTETPQSFANAEMGSSATLAEIATFPAAASPWGKPTLLQSLPLDAMGVGSVALTPWGLTHESAEMAGDPNAQPWTPDHLALKVAFTAWLIRNPRLAAGDRQWRKVQIRYQVCSSPYPNVASLGGLGFHTMFGDCGTEAGGTNPWSLYCKSCPGYVRRGYGPGKFPGVDNLPKGAGNFRDYYERVGLALLPPTIPETPDPMGDEMYVVLDTDKAKPAAAIWTAGGGWVSHVTTGADVLPAGSPIVPVPLAWFSRQWLVGNLPSDPNHAWKASEFRGHVPDPVTWRGPAGAEGPTGPAGPQGEPGPAGADGVIPPGTTAQAQVTFA